MSASTQLTHFKKVYKKVQSKKYHLIEQDLKELKAKEQKKKNSIKVESLITLIAYQSPLTDSFKFDFFFLTLPNIIFSSTSLPFL